MKILTFLGGLLLGVMFLLIAAIQTVTVVTASAASDPQQAVATITGTEGLNWTGTGHPTSGVSKSQTVVVHGLRVHASFAAQFGALMEAAKADGIRMGGWGWRSPADQIRLRKKHCGTSYYAVYQMPSSRCRPPTARPGSSRHERGTAVDLTCAGRSFGGTRCATWMFANVKLNPVTCQPSSIGEVYADRANCWGIYNYWRESWHWSVDGH